MIRFVTAPMPESSQASSLRSDKLRAYVTNAENVDFEEFAEAVARRGGMDGSYVRAILEMAFKELGAMLAAGRRVDFGSFAEAYTTIKGTFESAYSPFDPERNTVCAHLRLKAKFKEKIASDAAAKKPVNVTDGDRPHIVRVLDVESKTPDTITTREDGTVPEVLVSGKGLAELDEARLEPLDAGGDVVEGEVTSATGTTLDCEFPYAPSPGRYRLVLYSSTTAAAASRIVQVE